MVLPILSLFMSVSTLLSVFVVVGIFFAKNWFGESVDMEMHENDFVVQGSKKTIVINLYMVIIGGVLAVYNLFFLNYGILFTVIICIVAFEAFYLTYHTVASSSFRLAVNGEMFTSKSLMRGEQSFNAKDIKWVDVTMTE